jgi:hypothetical protein
VVSGEKSSDREGDREKSEAGEVQVGINGENLYANRNRIIMPHGPSPEKEGRIEGKEELKHEIIFMWITGMQTGSRAGRQAGFRRGERGMAKVGTLICKSKHGSGPSPDVWSESNTTEETCRAGAL